MTWPALIAAAIGITAALLITHHQHRSTTAPPKNPQDGERP